MVGPGSAVAADPKQEQEPGREEGSVEGKGVGLGDLGSAAAQGHWKPAVFGADTEHGGLTDEPAAIGSGCVTVAFEPRSVGSSAVADPVVADPVVAGPAVAGPAVAGPAVAGPV